MQSTTCDMFYHGRECLCVGLTQVPTKCIQCKCDAWMHYTFMRTQIPQGEAGKHLRQLKNSLTEQCFDWWNKGCMQCSEFSNVTEGTQFVKF